VVEQNNTVAGGNGASELTVGKIEFAPGTERWDRAVARTREYERIKQKQIERERIEQERIKQERIAQLEAEVAFLKGVLAEVKRRFNAARPASVEPFRCAYCGDHTTQECENCGNSTCRQCSHECSLCERTVCQECARKRSIHRRTVRRGEQDFVRNVWICDACHIEDTFTCEVCHRRHPNEDYCGDGIEVCIGCASSAAQMLEVHR
jgi:hypothetical protein